MPSRGRYAIIFLAFGCMIFLAGCPEIIPIESLEFAGPYGTGFYLARPETKLNVSVFYPIAEPPLTDAPLVVFSAGWNQPRTSYDCMATELAQWGYVVIVRYWPSLGAWIIGNDFLDTQVQHAIRLIDWAEQEAARPDSPLYQMVDTTRVGMTGHSLGGSVAIAAATLDNRIKACVPLDAAYEQTYPARFASPSTSAAAFMYVTSGSGGICSRPPLTTNLYEVTRPPAAEVIIHGADHLDFIQNRVVTSMLSNPFTSQTFENPLGRLAPRIDPCPGGSQDAHTVRALASKYMIAWFNVYLRDQKEFETYYCGALAAEDLAANLVTVRLNLGESYANSVQCDGCN